MKYIIMCGGDYQQWKMPRQLIKINNETIVERTIRLLRNHEITDIAITSNNPVFKQFGVPVLHHNNPWKVFGLDKVSGTWVDAFYPSDSPICYLLGDVVFSDNAINTIVTKETTDIDFFASAPPFAPEYKKQYAEPFAFKVVDTERFRTAINSVKEHEAAGDFKRPPIAWELWQIIKSTPLNVIDYTNYTVINDFTCDIDWENEVDKFIPYIEKEIIKEK